MKSKDAQKKKKINLVALRPFKIQKASLAVDGRRSKTSLLATDVTAAMLALTSYKNMNKGLILY